MPGHVKFSAGGLRVENFPSNLEEVAITLHTYLFLIRHLWWTCSSSQLAVSLGDSRAQQLKSGRDADLFIRTTDICPHRKLGSWRKTLLWQPASGRTSTMIWLLNSRRSLSPIYMIINALSASKRHYEKCVNVYKDGSNKLLIMIAGVFVSGS